MTSVWSQVQMDALTRRTSPFTPENNPLLSRITIPAGVTRIRARMKRERRVDYALTQDAREKVSGSRRGYVVDIGVFLLAGALIAALVFADLNESSQRAFDIVLGTILGAFGAVVTY